MHLQINTYNSTTHNLVSSAENSTNGSTANSPNGSRRNSLATLNCNSPDKAYIKPEFGQNISMKDMMVDKEGAIDSDEDTLADESTMTHVEKNEDTDPYCIFSKRKKWAIVMMAAVATFISPLTANIFLPAMNSMQEVGLFLNIKMTIHSLLTDFFTFTFSSHLMFRLRKCK
jgi:hypothetical protein